MSEKIDSEFLAKLEHTAKTQIHVSRPTKLFREKEPIVVLNANEVLAWIEHTRHLKDTSIDLLADLQKVKKQMKETQFLSTLWIQALTNHIPKDKRPLALKDAAKLIVEGMKKEGIEEYESPAQLEEEPNTG